MMCLRLIGQEKLISIKLWLREYWSRGTILEIGCGTGRIAIKLGQKGVNIMGFDLSPDILAVARQKSQEMTNTGGRYPNIN